MKDPRFQDLLNGMEALQLDQVVVERGQVLFRQGDPGDSLFLVKTGRLRVIYNLGLPNEHLVGEVGPGEPVGELALLWSSTRSATVVAVRGSTYRRPGARLLIPQHGEPIGNISGGCLEADVAEVGRRVLVEGAWAYRYPAKVSRHLQLRLEKVPKAIQDISWKAQVRLCKRYRRLVARGKQVNQVVVAIAREMAAFVWAIARAVKVAH
jgi:hypothetical protein